MHGDLAKVHKLLLIGVSLGPTPRTLPRDISYFIAYLRGFHLEAEAHALLLVFVPGEGRTPTSPGRRGVARATILGGPAVLTLHSDLAQNP